MHLTLQKLQPIHTKFTLTVFPAGNKQTDMASYDIYKSRIYLPDAFPYIWTYKIASPVATAAEKLSTVTTISVTF